jgi:hypothetical protein
VSGANPHRYRNILGGRRQDYGVWSSPIYGSVIRVQPHVVGPPQHGVLAKRLDECADYRSCAGQSIAIDLDGLDIVPILVGFGLVAHNILPALAIDSILICSTHAYLDVWASLLFTRVSLKENRDKA